MKETKFIKGWTRYRKNLKMPFSNNFKEARQIEILLYEYSSFFDRPAYLNLIKNNHPVAIDKAIKMVSFERVIRKDKSGVWI
jgi:hypothetical protein